MDVNQIEEAEKQKTAFAPVLIFSVVLLFLYPLSVPFYHLVGQSLPVWMHDYYLPLSHIYDPLEWLYFNVEWVGKFYDWYLPLFPIG